MYENAVSNVITIKTLINQSLTALYKYHGFLIRAFQISILLYTLDI